MSMATDSAKTRADVELVRQGLLAARDRRRGEERDYDFLRDLSVSCLQALDRLLAALEEPRARLEAAERERDAARDEQMTVAHADEWLYHRFNQEYDRAEAAEADAEQLRETFRVPGVPALLARAEAAEAALAEARAALGELWNHIHPEPKMSGASVVTRTRIPPEIAGRVLIALAAAGETAAPMQFAWLVERGQSEKHSPTVWWIGGPDTTNRSGESWTQDAFKATCFARRDDAQEIVDRLFTHRGEPTARAVEHGFASASAAGETAPSEPGNRHSTAESAVPARESLGPGSLGAGDGAG
jgi:hypothetical protein